MRHFTLFILSIVSFYSLKAQTSIGPPSLSLGTDQVLFQKGILDVAIIGDIIAEKQQEVKKELAKRLILDKALSKGPYLTYNYAEKVLTTLLNHKDKSVIKKSLLEHSAEVAIVLGITESYIRIKPDKIKELEAAFLKYKSDQSAMSILNEVMAHGLFSSESEQLKKSLISDKIDLQNVNQKRNSNKFAYDLMSGDNRASSINNYLPKISKIYGLKKLGRRMVFTFTTY